MHQFKKYGTIFFQVMLYLALILTLVCGMVKCGIGDRDKLFQGIVDEKFDQTILDAAEHAFYTEQSIIAFSSEELYGQLDKDTLLKDSHQYTSAVIDSLLTGCELHFYESEHGELAEVVKKQFEDFARESGSSVSEEDIEAVTDLMKNNINRQANYLPEVFNRIVPKIGNTVNRYFSMIENLFFPLGILSACLIIVIFIMNQDNFSRAAYKSALPVWMGAVTVFIPTMIFCSYDVGERMKLKSSGMASFAQGFVRTVEGEMELWSIAAFAIATILLAVCIAWYSLVQSKRHRKYIRES